jgi:hypothetical protein
MLGRLKNRVGRKRKEAGRRAQEDYEGYTNDRKGSSQVQWNRWVLDGLYYEETLSSGVERECVV